jgi:hypothetical protein
MLVLIVHHLAKWTIDWVEWTLQFFLQELDVDCKSIEA